METRCMEGSSVGLYEEFLAGTAEPELINVNWGSTSRACSVHDPVWLSSARRGHKTPASFVRHLFQKRYQGL